MTYREDLDRWDLDRPQDKPYALIQWKGTDVRMDLICLGCGAELALYGMFFHQVECEYCGHTHEMKALVEYRTADPDTYPRRAKLSSDES